MLASSVPKAASGQNPKGRYRRIFDLQGPTKGGAESQNIKGEKQWKKGRYHAWNVSCGFKGNMNSFAKERIGFCLRRVRGPFDRTHALSAKS
jgi:hypothetical protein